MGATNISHVLKGKADKKAIEQAFRDRQEQDRYENGHQEGYSGDFQTVHTIDFTYLGDVYPNYQAAEEVCLEHAEKWSTVVAVYYEHNGETRTMLAGWGAE